MTVYTQVMCSDYRELISLRAFLVLALRAAPYSPWWNLLPKGFKLPKSSVQTEQCARAKHVSTRSLMVTRCAFQGVRSLKSYAASDSKEQHIIRLCSCAVKGESEFLQFSD